MPTAQHSMPRADKVPARARLLDAASALLGERDNLDVSLVEIAARSGLNHGLVGYYFGGKEGLLTALLERDALTALAALERLVASPLPPEHKLERHIRGVIQTYYRFPYINRLINRLQSESPETAELLARVFIAPLQALQYRIVAEGIAVGRFRRVDPWFLYHAVIGMCEFVFQSRSTLPFLDGARPLTPETCDAYAAHVLNLVLRGIAADTSQDRMIP